MAWGRISDDLADHPKVADAAVDLEGLAAMGLWTLTLSWVRADRRRAGTVPTGIAMRFAAGHGKQLASRLVEAGLWDEVDGGYHFHDYEDIYTPDDLSAKRAEAGRSGGKASGRTRAAKAASKQVDAGTAETTKQLASSKTGSNRTRTEPGAVSLFDEHDPLTADTSPSNERSKHEANTKQLASSDEANRLEASRARAGTTTHYPEASYEASTSSPPANGDEKPINAGTCIAAYIDAAVAAKRGKPSQALIKQVGAAAKRLLAEPDMDPTRVLNAARVAGSSGWKDLDLQLQRMPTAGSNNGAYIAQRVNHDEPGAHTKSWDRRRANAQQ